MLRNSFVRRMPFMIGLLFLLGGCGFQQVQSRNQTAPTSQPIPTPTTVPAPKPHITGGSVAAVVNGTAIPMRLYRDFLHSALIQYATSPNGVALNSVPSSTIHELIQNEPLLQQAQKIHVT